MVKHFISQSDTLYRAIVDTYANDYPNYLPLSAIRLSEMELLAAATKAVLPAVAEHLKQGDDAATKGIIYYYSPGERNDNYNKSMYDMNDMIRMALVEQPDAYNTWHEAFQKAMREGTEFETPLADGISALIYSLAAKESSERQKTVRVPDWGEV
jgi:hypothetical protein